MPAVKTSIRALFLFGLLLAALRAMPARADIWGFVDESGRAHMASEQLDGRYQLFFKGAKQVGGPKSTLTEAAVEAPVAISAEASAAEEFRHSAKFIRTSSQSNVKRFETMIEEAAKQQKVDPALVKAIVAVESSFQPDAISPKGARGLMQVIPDTAGRYGVVGDRNKSAGQKLLDPATNLRVGAQHLSNLMSMFASNLELALAAYNAGEGAVLRYARKIPPFPETQEYVKLVKQFYAGFKPPVKPASKITQVALAAPAKPMGIATVAVPTALVAWAAYTPPAVVVDPTAAVFPFAYTVVAPNPLAGSNTVAAPNALPIAASSNPEISSSLPTETAPVAPTVHDIEGSDTQPVQSSSPTNG